MCVCVCVGHFLKVVLISSSLAPPPHVSLGVSGSLDHCCSEPENQMSHQQDGGREGELDDEGMLDREMEDG